MGCSSRRQVVNDESSLTTNSPRYLPEKILRAIHLRVVVSPGACQATLACLRPYTELLGFGFEPLACGLCEIA